MSLSKTNEASVGNELLVGWEAGVRQLCGPSRMLRGGRHGEAGASRASPRIRASAHRSGAHCLSLCPGPGAAAGHRQHLAEEFSL